MKRLLPLVVLLAVLIGGSAAAVFAITGDGDGPTSAEGIAPGECSLVHNVDACEEHAAGMCVEGAEECVDMIVGGDGQEPITIIDDMDPNECSLVHNIDACEAGVFNLTIDFSESVTQADMAVAQEELASFDPDVQLLVLESFPPMGRATVRTAEPDFCDEVQAMLSDLAGVRSVTCEPTTAPPSDVSPDEPVSSTP
jgi:hypothetical protein